jgi:hypothetical protein
MSDSTITVRSNLYLWLLTGRSGDFFNEALNSGVAYSASDTPAEVKAMRQLLKLEETSTDFFVLAALAAARMSTSFLRTLPHEHDAVFVRGFLALPSISTSRPMLPPDDRSWPSIDGGRAGRDGFTQVVIRSAGGGKASITTNAGGTDATACVVVPDTGGYRLSIEKAAEYGIRAHFLVPSWDPEDEVVVRFSPTRYPFADVAATIGGNSTARQLMTSEGVMAAFSETENPATKVGLLSLAIMRRMIRYINEGQVGFDVVTSFDPDGAEPLQRVYSLDPTFSASLDTPKATADEPAGFDV